MKSNKLRYGVIGHPITHSLSPKIHQAFAEQLNIQLQYDAIDIKPSEFEQQLTELKQQGYCGFNITVPFKEMAYQLSSQKSTYADIAQAVNTIYFEDQTVVGDNTDGIGFLRDLTINQQFSLLNKRILLLGAGGAARSILLPFIESCGAHIHIANRTVEKADKLAKQCSNQAVISISDFEQIPNENFDLVINATSYSITNDQNNFPQHIFLNNHFFYDLVYNLKSVTPFLQLAKQHGAKKLIDGLGMLIEQAAESFFIWHQIRPETKHMIETLKNKEI